MCNIFLTQGPQNKVWPTSLNFLLWWTMPVWLSHQSVNLKCLVTVDYVQSSELRTIPKLARKCKGYLFPKFFFNEDTGNKIVILFRSNWPEKWTELPVFPCLLQWLASLLREDSVDWAEFPLQSQKPYTYPTPAAIIYYSWSLSLEE